MILEPKIIKSATVSTVSPSICHEVMGPDADLHFLNVELFLFFFPISQFIASGGQSIGVSASASVLPMNIQD